MEIEIFPQRTVIYHDGSGKAETYFDMEAVIGGVRQQVPKMVKDEESGQMREEQHSFVHSDFMSTGAALESEFAAAVKENRAFVTPNANVDLVARVEELEGKLAEAKAREETREADYQRLVGMVQKDAAVDVAPVVEGGE